MSSWAIVVIGVRVRRHLLSSSVNFSSKIISSETTGGIATKLGHNGPWYILFSIFFSIAASQMTW